MTASDRICIIFKVTIAFLEKSNGISPLWDNAAHLKTVLMQLVVISTTDCCKSVNNNNNFDFFTLSEYLSQWRILDPYFFVRAGCLYSGPFILHECGKFWVFNTDYGTHATHPHLSVQCTFTSVYFMKRFIDNHHYHHPKNAYRMHKKHTNMWNSGIIYILALPKSRMYHAHLRHILFRFISTMFFMRTHDSVKENLLHDSISCFLTFFFVEKMPQKAKETGEFNEFNYLRAEFYLTEWKFLEKSSINCIVQLLLL